MDLGVWLRGLGLERYEPVFRAQALDDGEVLCGLTEEHLKELAIPLGDRLRLLRAIDDLRARSDRGDAPSPATTEQVVGPGRRGERRHVAVLFADLAGFTALSRKLDAEEVHLILEQLFESADRIVLEHGGRVDKHIGDCVMAVFGAPLAHGNDAERAARAALAIRDALGGIEVPDHGAIQMHIGVASGQVVASGTGSRSHRAYTVTGETVNLASRLTDAAAPGEVLVSDAIRRMLHDRIVCTATDALEVKGFEHPIQAWRLDALRAAPAGGRALVGREAELATFQGALNACLASRAGRTILIRGEAGIGKTRLVEELERLAQRTGFTCHRALVLDFGGGGTGSALVALAASLLGIAAGRAPAAHAAAVQAIEDGWLAPADRVHLYDLLGLDRPDELRPVSDGMDHSTRSHGRQRVLVALVEHAAAGCPCVVVVEDVHWADRPTLDGLAALAGAVGAAPALLVMTSRPAGDPIDRGWQARAGASLTTIDLAPLGAEDGRRLARDLGADPAFAERCIERAGGNPLFLDQLLRHGGSGDGSAVPDSVQSLIQARLDRLDAIHADLLRAASVLGQRFAADALAHLVGRTVDFEPLVTERLIRPDQDALLFAHALIRDSVYASLLRADRRALHRRAADWYRDRDASLRAQHLDRAEDPAAAVAYLEAADRAFERFHHDRAAALAARGLEIGGDAALRYQLASRHAEVLLALGASGPAADAYQQALGAAQDDLERARAWIGLAEAYRILDRLDEALALLDRAQAAIADGAPALLTRIHHLRGNLFFPLGRLEDCAAEHRAAFACAREAGAPDDEARALGGLADADYALGRMLTAHRHFSDAVERSERQGLVRIAAANRAMAAFTRFFANDVRGALEAALEAIEAAARIGHLRAEMIAHHGAYSPLFYLADFRRAEQHVARALEIARRLGARRFEAEAVFFQGELARTEGRRGEAIELLENALAMSGEGGMTYFGPTALAGLALALDAPERQRALLAEGERILASGAVSHNYLFFYRDAAETMLVMGDVDAAERYAGALEEYTRAEPLPWSDFVVRRVRALAALRRDGPTPALVSAARGLCREAESSGLLVAVPGLEAALAGAT